MIQIKTPEFEISFIHISLIIYYLKHISLEIFCRIDILIFLLSQVFCILYIKLYITNYVYYIYTTIVSTYITVPESSSSKLDRMSRSKELSFCHKFKFSNPYIFATRWCKPMIFQNYQVYDIRLLRYRGETFRVCGKNSYSLCEITGMILWPCSPFSFDFMRKYKKSKFIRLHIKHSNNFCSSQKSFDKRSYDWKRLKFQSYV